jgi:hypothetical protein
MRVLLALVLVTGCSKHAKEVCEKAADKYEACVGEILGPEIKDMVHDKREIGACADDGKTVKMYEGCLKQSSCDKFMDCVDEYAATHAP